MADNGPEGISLIKNVVALIGGVGVIGYFLKGFSDRFHKKRNVKFEDRKKAADAIQPIIKEYIELSKDLDKGAGIIPSTTIDAYQKNIGRLVELKNQLSNLSNEHMHHFDRNMAEKIAEMNSLLSSQLEQLTNDFIGADESRLYDGDVHKIMKDGIEMYRAEFESKTLLVMSTVKEHIRESVA